VSLWALLLIASAWATASESDLSEAVGELAEGSFQDKARAAERLAGFDHPRASVVLQALLSGSLYQRREDNRLVITDRRGSRYELEDAVTGEPLPNAGGREVRRVATSNALRSQLRAFIARGQLRAPDQAVRLAAVREIIDDPDPASVRLIRERMGEESDGAVRHAMKTVLALQALEDGEDMSRVEAASHLAGRLDGAVRERLTVLANDNSVEPLLRAEAQASLRAIERRLMQFRALETVFFGLSMGSVLVLAAIGLSITFGVMGVINMAHGELIMLGAYTTYVVQNLMPEAIGWSLLVALPAAFAVSGSVGIAIERGVIRFLHGRPLETLLATFGISLILQQGVRSVFSALNRSVTTPAWMSGSWQVIPGLSVTYNRLYILLFSLTVFVALLTLLKRTRLGLEVRAISQNREMARAMGIRSHRVDALTFGLGSGIAGVAGVALSQLTNVGPNLGQAYIVDSFLVVVFGGVGNLWGTLVGGLSLGVVNKFLEPATGAVLAKILVLVMIILFIQKRPRGLFPQKGRAAET
jgi:urea transport system permease protein